MQHHSSPYWNNVGRPTNSQLIHALQVTKTRLSNETRHICTTLNELANEGEIQYQTARYLKHWIESMLGGSSTYTLWVGRCHEKAWNIMTAEDMMEGRRQWIDWMIAELKKDNHENPTLSNAARNCCAD